MARIRTIKPDFFKHEELYELEKQSKLPVRLAFIGLWTVADREGRFKWRPNQLKLDCLPYDQIDFSRVLDALATRGFITEYCESGVDDGEKYGFINTFTQNQVINNREAESILPSPFDACMTRDPRGLCNSKWKGKEGKGKESENEDESSSLFLIDVNQEILKDYLKVRKAKKAGEFTETSFNEIKKEASKVGLSIDEALAYCCKRSWVGFESAWFLKDNPSPVQQKRGLVL